MGLSKVVTKILDQWSFFDYKAAFTGSLVGQPIGIASWITDEDRRRLSGYALMESYFRNSAREWLSDAVTDEDRNTRREYGDPHLIVQVTMSSLLGTSQRILTEGSIGNEDPIAVAQQELLERWAEKEKFGMKIVESERQSVKLGDSIYALGWDATAGRPRVHVYDPGFYFPRFDPINKGAEDYPREVHIAYEYEDEDERGQLTTYVRRITWKMLPVEEPLNLMWNDGPVNESCFYLDAVWKQADINGLVHEFDVTQIHMLLSNPDNMEESMWTNLEIDFIPLVHVPNTVNLQGHFGDSVIAPVMQVLDDVMSTDTDVQAAASTTGTPPIVASGSGVGSDKVQSYGPGTILNIGEGSATVLDTSAGLTALLNLKDALLERLSVNSRTPESLLGRVKPNEVPSGIALTLSFTPHSSMIKEMRLVREEKYALLLKFVSRFYAKAGALSQIRPAKVILGSFLPADRSEAATLVVQLLGMDAISLETAVNMLVEAGFPIEDLVEEIARIQSRDFAGANSLVVMTGDINRGMDYLGMEPVQFEDQDEQLL